ncbi:MAG: protein prkA [Patescibacteria group bacterium]
MNESNNIFSDIEKYLEKLDTTEWSGTIKEYIPMVQQNSKLSQLAHARVLEMIESAGVEFEEKDKNKQFPKYNFFKKDLFGVDDALHKIVKYLKAAASGSQVGRRILLLYGPTSSGKSQLASLLKNGLEEYSRTENGALYSISDCPIHENPLNAVPYPLRKKFRDDYGIKIDPLARLCPLCQFNLADKYKNDWLSMPVKRIFVSESSRVGIGTFLPGDTKNQSITELVGSVDFSKLGDFGVESDPRAYKFDGELNVANRGIMEMIEMLKVDPKFLYVLLTLAQEKTIKTERFPLIYADEFIIAHTNETEYRRFLADQKLEALHDRIIVCKCPYNMILNDEVKIYDKLVSEADFGGIHIAPLTLKVASMFAVLSRLEAGKDQNLTLLKKMQLYNGQDVEGFTAEDVKDIKEETEREGMIGISPRYIFNCIADCFTKYDLRCITPIDVLRSIKENFESNAKLTKEDIAKYDDLLTVVVEEYTKMAKSEVQKAFFLNFEGEIKNLLNNYIDNVGAYLDDTSVEDEFGDHHEPDKYLMRNIEEKVGVSESAKDSFRQEVYRKVIKTKDEKGEFDYKSHAKLREALEKQLFDERSDVIRLTVSTRNPDPEALQKLNSVIDTLVKFHGYTPESANQLLRYVSSLMSRTT